jgi:hypothetical protein
MSRKVRRIKKQNGKRTKNDKQYKWRKEGRKSEQKRRKSE